MAHSPTDGDNCPLDVRLQERNLRIFAAQVSLIYLAAPVIYVGFMQAALFKRLHASDTVANLPSTIFLSMSWFPVVVAWLFPQVRLLKPLMAIAYATIAGVSLIAGLIVGGDFRPSFIMGAVMVHALVLGCGNGLVYTLGWEALNRGVSASRHGKALGLAYGMGPGLAVVGSLGAQLLLNGSVLGWHLPSTWTVDYPMNYALLFGESAVAMGIAAVLSRFYRLPAPAVENVRETFGRAVLSGREEILRHRVLLYACLAYFLVYCGNLVQTNMSLFTREVIGQAPEDFAGYQLALRFSFKVAAGIFLGWLLDRTNPKMPLLVTIGLQLAGVLWVLLVPGYWFLIAFGINGAGELFGVYYTNYPMRCSSASRVRQNIAFLMVLTSFVGIAPLLYGWIADTWNLRASLWAALVLLSLTTILVVLKLPNHPRTRED